MRVSIVRVVFFFAFALPFSTLAQTRQQHLLELYQYVDRMDSLSSKSQKTFYLEKFSSDDRNYREKWLYATEGDRIVYFEIDYIKDSLEFTEIYYVNRGRLICSEEYEKINYSVLEDELKKGGVFYFNGMIPEHVVMLGRGYQYNPSLSPDLVVMQRFEKRFTELKRHIPMLP